MRLAIVQNVGVKYCRVIKCVPVQSIEFHLSIFKLDIFPPHPISKHVKVKHVPRRSIGLTPDLHGMTIPSFCKKSEVLVNEGEHAPLQNPQPSPKANSQAAPARNVFFRPYTSAILPNISSRHPCTLVSAYTGQSVNYAPSSAHRRSSSTAADPPESLGLPRS